MHYGRHRYYKARRKMHDDGVDLMQVKMITPSQKSGVYMVLDIMCSNHVLIVYSALFLT